MNLWRSTKTDGGVEMHKKMGTAMGALNTPLSP